MLKHWQEIFSNLVLVDLETTGLDKTKDRVIEVAAVVVRGNKVVEKYQTLVDPGFEISDRISKFTGIKKSDLVGKPSFAEVAPELISVINRGGVFVAHNAPFDYGFLEEEFKRVDMPFASSSLCTVDLSRALYPGESSHNLDAIMKRFNIRIKNRHRALDDVMATWYFFQKVNDLFDDYALGLTYQRIFRPASAKRVAPVSQVQLGLLG